MMLQPVMDWGTGKKSHDNWEHAEIRVELSDMDGRFLSFLTFITSFCWFH